MTKITQQPRTIAIISELDLIGDAFLKLPFLRHVKTSYSDAQISWITSKGASSFEGPLRFLADGFIQEFIREPPWLSKGKPIQTRPYFDLILDTRNRWREAYEARKIPHAYFIAQAAHYALSDIRPRFFSQRPRHLSERLLEMARLLSHSPVQTAEPIVLSEVVLKEAARILPKGPTYIGLAPGCSTPNRQWSRLRFEALADWVSNKGYKAVFILGPLESHWYAEMKNRFPDAIFPLQSLDQKFPLAQSIQQTMAFGKHLALAVTNDSGPAHILGAVHCPLLVLYGPTSPKKAAPLTPLLRTLEAESYGGSTMETIPLSAAENAIEDLLIEILKPHSFI